MITQALLNLDPSLRFSINENVENEADYNQIIWFTGVDKDNTAVPGTPEKIPSWSAVQTEIESLKQAFISKEYQRKRQPEYPALEDQLDMIYHGIHSGGLDKNSEFYLSLKKVKDKYPK